MATLVEGDPMAPFSITITPRYKGGRYSVPWIAPLYPWSLPYNTECWARRLQVPFFKSLVWLDLGLNLSLTDHWRTHYSLDQWSEINLYNILLLFTILISMVFKLTRFINGNLYLTNRKKLHITQFHVKNKKKLISNLACSPFPWQQWAGSVLPPRPMSQSHWHRVLFRLQQQ